MSGLSISSELQIKDVYDLAFDIAKEFEKLISCFDHDEAIPIINKVINVLELLEDSVRKIENLEKENAELRAKCFQLSNEKIANEEDKLHLKQAFEELEESWTKEEVSLRSYIEKLKTENKLLQRNLRENTDIPLEIGDSYKIVIEDQENVISKLKSNLKQKDDQLEKSNLIIEKLNQKVDHLLELNKSLHLRYQEAKNVITSTNEEKTEYETEVDVQKAKVHSLEKKFEILKMSIIEKKECDMKGIYNCQNQVSYLNEESLKSLIEEQHKLGQRIFKLQLQLSQVQKQAEEYKEKLLKLTGKTNEKQMLKPAYIQQIFRLFLGIVRITPQVW